MSISDMATEKIRTLFESRNIYQSVVICKNEYTPTLFELLRDEGYPIARASIEDEYEKFKQFDDRMLITSYSQWSDIKAEVSVPTVNTMIFVSCQPETSDGYLMRHAQVFIFSM